MLAIMNSSSSSVLYSAGSNTELRESHSCSSSTIDSFRDSSRFEGYCPSTPLHAKPNSSMIFSDSPSRYHLPYNECISDEYALAEAAATVPICEAPNLSKVEPNENIQVGNNEESGQPFSKLIAAEHRVRALIDAIQPAGGVNDVWSNSIEKMTEGSMVTSPTATNRAENPAGVIGSPVKGKGGAYACRHRTSIDT